ncbi:hypothetical protein KDA23_01510 [Candidatus Saccharibacteria bacterium]|nr:hypothetical protein [Candidatus Saccharibacteria bacterium]
MVSKNPESGQIEYTPQEQRDFDLPESVEPFTAVRTAAVFMHVAGSLQDRAHNIDVSTLEGRHSRITMCTRANKMAALATSTFALCPDEHLALITSYDPLEQEATGLDE